MPTLLPTKNGKELKMKVKNKENTIKKTGMAVVLLAVVFLLLYALSGFIKYYTEWKRSALTGYMEQLKENVGSPGEVTVAVIDSGCSVDEAYTGRISDKAWSFVEAGTDVADEYGHGSQMASLILHNTPDSVSILPLKVMDGEGKAGMEDVAAALSYAYENGADVISLSMNAVLCGEEDLLTELMEEITRAGIPVIVSAGNAGTDVKNLLPANVESALVIGAANSEYNSCDFSNYGDTVDFCAYGKFNGEWGTSFAAAYVTSIVAELKAYGEEDVEGIFHKYAAFYEKRNGHACGEGYLWVDYAVAVTEDAEETAGNLYLGGSTETEYDLGGDIMGLDWKNTDGEKLNEYFAFTDEAYVGRFLESLSEEELEELEAKSSILHSQVDINSYRYDGDTGEYIPEENVSYDFMEYCIDSYHAVQGKMMVSSQWISANHETYFVMSNEERTSRYLFEISGLARGEASDVNGMLINREDARITIGKKVILGTKKDPFAPVNTDARNYLTDVTARYTKVLNSDGSIREIIERPDHNRQNEADNGWCFYGLSIDFEGIKSEKEGYHFAPGQKAYNYGGGSTTQAYIYNLSRLTDEGYVYVTDRKDAPTIAPMTSNFNDLTGPFTLVNYIGLYEEAYRNNPTGKSNEEAENMGYKVDTKPDVYKVSDRSSLNIDAGTISMNVGYYELSGMKYYDLDTGNLAIENDYAEYVFQLVPNQYTVTADARGGTVNDYPNNGGRRSTAEIPVTYDNSYYDNISGLAPRKDGYIFGGWYTSDGEQVWDGNGLAKKGNKYWNDSGIWKYLGNLTVYAKWIPSSYVQVDANWGTVTDYIHNTGSTNITGFYTEYGQDYYDDISRLYPVRDGFVFQGWYVDPDDPDNSSGKDVGRNGGVKVWDADGKAVEGTGFWKNGTWCYDGGNVVAFAHWSSGTPTNYTASFNANGGTLYDYIHTNKWTATAYCSVETGKNYYDNVSKLAPKREGHTFLGWYDQMSGGKKVYNSSGTVTNEGTYFKNNLWQYKGDKTFYAQWDICDYTVKFHANGGTGSKAPMTGLAYGQTYTLSANNPPSEGFTKTGYDFNGWNTKADGSGKAVGNGESFSNLTETDGATVILHAQWKDVTPPMVDNENVDDLDPSSTTEKLIYGWTNKDIRLRFTAADTGSGMKSLILYEGHGTAGTILQSRVDNVEYLVSSEGIHHYTVVATDNSGNTKTIYITTKIDHVTPKGTFTLDYDGYKLTAAVDNIIEECTGNEASGCKEAWIDIKGLDTVGNILYEETLPLTLMTPGNIYTGASYAGEFELGDGFNYESDFIQVNAYVKDNAGNYLPAIGEETVPAFTVKGCVERCLGPANQWNSGEAGNVYVYTASFVDAVFIEYPSDWVDIDDTLANRIYDYTGNQTKEKNETDLFYIPLYAENGEYNIIVHAFKNGREKTVTLPVVTDGSILEKIRTRLR